MSRIHDRVGQVHGVFKVTSFAYVKNAHAHWNCVCLKCGSTSVRPGRYFRKDRVVPTLCRKCVGENHHLFKGHKDISGTYFERIKTQAKERNIYFGVTIEEVWDLFIKQDRKCYLSGLELEFGKDQTASLDRLDSRQGYIIDNLSWCHKDINIMKNIFTVEKFKHYCDLVSKLPKVPEIT